MVYPLSFLILFILFNPLNAEELKDNLYLTNLSIENNKGLVSVKICCENKSEKDASLRLVLETIKTGKSGNMKTFQSQNLLIKPSESLCNIRNVFSINKEDNYILKVLLIKDNKIIFKKEIKSEDFS